MCFLFIPEALSGRHMHQPRCRMHEKVISFNSLICLVLGERNCMRFGG